jgi:hypothetical protein
MRTDVLAFGENLSGSAYARRAHRKRELEWKSLRATAFRNGQEAPLGAQPVLQSARKMANILLLAGRGFALTTAAD